MATMSEEAAESQRRKRAAMRALGKLGVQRKQIMEAKRENEAAVIEACHDGKEAGLTLKEMGDALELTAEGVRQVLEKPRVKPRPEAPTGEAPPATTRRRGRPKKTTTPAKATGS
jgi:DNA-directed RNA polymerase sigma subunit (sigma70/sigma32)